MTFVWILIGILIGLVIGGIAMLYYIGKGMFR